MIQTIAAISVNGLEKSYKNLKVLKKINIKPDKGSAQICGFDVVRQSDKVRREISLTGQYAALDDVLTERENLRMIGKLRHLPDANNKTDELLERFHLLDAADRRVATYSGGRPDG
jgi:ABC-2 type transport system ATP-binding protein